MSKSITLKCELEATPREVFEAWLDSDEHTAMTGGKAVCCQEDNHVFIAWDGYISGTNKTIVPYKKIVQNWRTTEFADSDPDSELTIELDESKAGCLLTLIHRNVPDGQADYEKGWIEYYFEPMTTYFRSKRTIT